MGSHKAPAAAGGGVPRWVMGALAGLVALTAASFALALWLGTVRPLRMEVRHVAGVGGISRGAAVSPSAVVPLDLPVIDRPTEFPEKVSAVAVPVRPVESPVSASQPVSGAVAGVNEPLPVPPLPGVLRWEANAVPVKVSPATPKLALVLDDIGGIGVASDRALAELPPAVTFAVLPYGPESVHLAAQARRGGHEVLVHVPMEPRVLAGREEEMGPHGLRMDMAPAEVARNVAVNLDALKDFAVGVNNHMGSRFTTWEPGMRAVLTVLQGEGMLFLDSRTSQQTAVKAAAKGLDIPVLSRDIFLDHEPVPEKIRAELQRAVALAKKHGGAIVIGHPLPVTLDVLAQELPRLDGVVLVPVTAMLPVSR